MEKKQTHLMYGAIAGLASVLIYLGLYLGGLMFKPGMQYVPYIPMLIGIILNAVAFSKANGGAVTFGNVFGSGFKASMIVTIISLAWFLLCLYIIPEIKTKTLEAMHTQLAKDPKSTEADIMQSLQWMDKKYTTMMVSSTIYMGLFVGAVSALIGAIIARKKQ